MKIWVFLAVFLAANVSGGIIVDHTSTDISQIPDNWIQQVKQNIKVYYGHTSHGVQITEGLKELANQDSAKYSVAIGQGLPTQAGALCLRDASLYDWEADFRPTVAGVLSSNPQINVVMYEWCGQHSGSGWQALLNDYISDMQALEQQYPSVTFVYATGNAQEQDCTGCDRQQFNEQLRQFVRNNNRVLYDFGDLDAWYNGQQATYSTPSWCGGCPYQTIPRENDYWGGGNYNNECGHALRVSCTNKGKAFWWLLARIAGWNGGTQADITAPVRSGGSPSAALAAGTTSTAISLLTNEAATCRYSLSASTAFGGMVGTFSATGGTSHSAIVSGLQNGNSYRYYVRCSDVVGNVNGDDFVIGFSVAQAGSTCISGDLNCDGSVNIFDLVLVAQNFGRASGFDVRADANKDGAVNIFDLVLVAQNFGRTG